MSNIKHLTILHSNDLHGDFLSENVDNKLLGGVSMLSGYTNKVRTEEKNTLYVVAGDMFRGSVIDSEYRGISTIDIMNFLGPDVVSLGNHEVDYGISQLVFLEKCAKFPIVNANLYIKTMNTRLFNSHKIIEVDGMKVMFIGILTEEIMCNAKADSLLGTFVDVEEAANEIGKICNSYKTTDIDFTVILTHIGFEEDKKLATLLDPEWGVDVIIGGHSHTLPEKPEKVNGILITQAGVGTDQIGRFDINVDTDANSVDSYKWQIIPIDEAHCPRDLDLENIISKYKTETDKKYGRILTKFTHPLTHPKRNEETEIGNLFSDILVDSLGTDIVLLGSGSIRKPSLGPVVTYRDLVEIFPYDDEIYCVHLTKYELYRMFNHILREESKTGETEYYQISKGLQVTYSEKEKKVTNITFNGKPLEEDMLYSMAIQMFHYNNMKDFLNLPLEEISKNKKPRVISTSAAQILDEFLTNNIHLSASVENRYNFVD